MGLSAPGEGTTPANYHGEADTPDKAIRGLSRFIAVVEQSLRQGEYSECAASQVLKRAHWLISVIESAARASFKAEDLAAEMSSPPPFDCDLSPITATGTITAAGVTLNIQDQWGFQTYYNVKSPGGAVREITTPVFIDPAANNVSETYTYELQQCAPALGCSAWTSVRVKAI